MNILLVFWFFLGAAMGSFLNVVLSRLRKSESFVSGRSHCPHCRHRLAWYDLLPIISYLALRGRCRYCRARLSRRYLVIEIAVGALFALGAAVITDYWLLLVYLASASFFVLLFVFDATAYLVPDRVSLPAIAVVFLLNLLAGRPVITLFLGAGLGGVWFLLQFLLSGGRWVGGGDIRLGVLIGALLGYPLVLAALALAYVGGSIIALGLVIFRQKKFGSRLPFATILLPATLIIFLWGEAMWGWYVGVLGF